MGEEKTIKQTNFRIAQDTADTFRKFCEENGMSHAQGFDHMMQVMELDRAKAMVPHSAKDIEEFEMFTKKIMAAYLKSVEDYNTAQESAKEEFASALESKDKLIASLQEKVEQLKEDKKNAEQIAKDATQTADQAVKESAVSKVQAETASKLADEKDKTIATLADKLSIAEEKAEGYDALKKSEEASLRKIKELQKDHEIEMREFKADMERKISDTQKDATLSLVQAVADKEREIRSEYQAQIRQADKENAKLSALIDQLQVQIETLK